MELALEEGIDVRVVQAHRSPEEQQALYTSGAGVTKAPALLSYHNYGLAFDAVPVDYLKYPDWNPNGPLWKRLGLLGESLGLEWGGKWPTPDLPHFQIPSESAPIRELKAYYEKFKSIMPISITPSEGGALALIAVLILAGWFYREHL